MIQNGDVMEIQALKSGMETLNRRMEEVITILTGNSVYGVNGVKHDVSELKKTVHKIEIDIETIKRETIEREKNRAFLSIKMETIPQKLAAVVAFLAVALSVFQGIKALFVK